ncbi:MAG: hypothetical protein E7556_08510 [Ruminococcaceae bacterium]|nr:hypothetical protein [Oscillospiraceae bacterium]
MKKLKVTVILESIVVVFLLIIVFITNSEFIKSSEELIRYEGESKSGIYKAQVVQIGEPVGAFSSVEYKVSVFKNEMTINESFFYINDDGGVGDFKSEITNDSFTVTFYGSEQEPYSLIIPFDKEN